MEVEKLEELLLILSYKNENYENAQTAFNTLYREYSKYLYSVVRSNLFSNGIRNEQIIESVVNNTFITIYDNPLKFTFPDKNTDNNDKYFKAWISQIAKYELYDLLKEEKSNKLNSIEVINEPAFEETYIKNEIINIETINYKILEGALNTLSERDRDILRGLYLYHEEGKKTPTEVLNELCNYFKTTKANIRKVKERSENKIIEYFSKHSQLIPLKYEKGQKS